MISKATLHKATVLMNRRMNTERRVTTFGPVCSSVAGMSCIISEEGALRKRGAHSGGNEMRAALPGCSSGHRLSTLLWISSAMNESSVKAIVRRPIATRNRKWAQSATARLVSRNVLPNAISIAGMCACIAAALALGMTSVAYNRVLWLIAALSAQLRLTAKHAGRDGRARFRSRFKIGELYNEVPVVPCGLIGTFEALPPNRNVPPPIRINLVIAGPLNLQRLKTIVKVGHRSREASNQPPQVGCTINVRTSAVGRPDIANSC
jgi:hypothetical protein